MTSKLEQKGGYGTVQSGLNAEIKNILDKKYQLVADYPLPGREWSIKMYVGIGG